MAFREQSPASRRLADSGTRGLFYSRNHWGSLRASPHRDYSHPGGDVAVAVFDDRIEISSLGSLPAGMTAEMLSGLHQSVLRNFLIAETFHRTGAVEAWGRGTNRVIEECQRWGIEPPTLSRAAQNSDI